MIKQKYSNLICPIDGASLNLVNRQLHCSFDHHFDLAKQGYINLLPVQHKKSKSPGDTKKMIAARSRFLNSGIYQQVVNQLGDLIQTFNLKHDAIILDAGCGDGYYTEQLFKRFPDYDYMGMDVSKEAIISACKRNKSMHSTTTKPETSVEWLVASNKQPPIAPGTVDVIICIFGFHSFKGFMPLLKPGGKIVLIDPEAEHLIELRQLIYQQVQKRSAYSTKDAEQYQLNLCHTQSLCFNSQCQSQQQIQDLLLMTPHLFRASAQGIKDAEKLSTLAISVDMLIRVFEPAPMQL